MSVKRRLTTGKSATRISSNVRGKNTYSNIEELQTRPGKLLSEGEDSTSTSSLMGWILICTQIISGR